LTPESLLLTRLGLARESLAGQLAVVTGAGRGIGRAVALALAALGAEVAVAELANSGAETEAALRAAGGRGFWIRTDVSDSASVAHLVAEAPGAGILINNAILCPVAPVLEMDVALWDRVMAVNLRGTFLTCQAYLPGMLAAGRGTIVNMVSTDAMANLSAYIASKAGIAAFSRSLAAEVGEGGVHVVALAPGFVDTPGLREAAAGLAPRLGLTPEGFLRFSPHAAYAGAMPAADAAAATAYLVARLAADYHGEQVTGYQVLERAGYLATATETAAPSTTAAPESTAGSGSTAAPDAPAASALALCERLAAFLADTEADFARLPIFVRPLARGAFRQRTGHDGREWREWATALAAQLKGLAGGDAAGAAELHHSAAQSVEGLGRLAAYYQAAPAETARFTKDEAMLSEVRRIMAVREATTRSLQAALAAL